MNTVRATLARPDTAGSKSFLVDIGAGRTVPIGTEIDVDLDAVYRATFKHPVTHQQIYETVINVVDGNRITAAVQVACLDFPDGVEVPEPEEINFPEMLGDRAIEDLRDARAKPFGADPLSELYGTVMKAFEKLVGRNDRPRRIKIVDAASLVSLEEKINAFMDEGHEIALISDRIFRFGSYYAKEITYFLPEAEASTTAEKSEERSQ